MSQPIDNHMVANTADAPWNQPDDNRRFAHCGICGKIMVRSDKEWKYPWVDEDENNLRHAGAVPGDLVCSMRCRSQALYNASGPEQRKALETLVLHWEEIFLALAKLGVQPWQDPKTPSLFDVFYADMEDHGEVDEVYGFRRGADAIDALLVTDDPPEWVLAVQKP